MTPHDIYMALASLLLPPGWFFLLLTLGFIFRNLLGKNWGRVWASFTVLLLWVGSMPALGHYLLTQHIADLETIDRTQFRTSPEGLKHTAVVVLGLGGVSKGQEYGKPSLNAESYERLRYAVTLAKATGLPILYTGGAVLEAQPGMESSAQSEAAIAQETARGELQYNIKWIETKGITVRDSASYTEVILRSQQITNIVLVAHAWKMPRAVLAFQAAGLKVTPAPLGFPDDISPGIAAFFPTSEGVRWVRNVIRERLGMLRVAK